MIIRKCVISLICLLLLAVSQTASGYGIDGTKDSSDFMNRLGPYDRLDVEGYFDGYPKWSYEGKASKSGLIDNLGKNSISAYPDATITSDGSIMTQYINEIGGRKMTGSHKPFNNHFYLPSGASNDYPLLGKTDGFTVEWRVRLTAGRNIKRESGWGYKFGFITDEAENNWFRTADNGILKDNAGNYYDLEELTNGDYDTGGFNEYRIAVLGEDPTDPGIIKANFYVNEHLIISKLAVGTVGTTDESDYLWNGCEWGIDMHGDWHQVEIDYVRIDGFGAYAPVPEPGIMLLLGSGLMVALKHCKKIKLSSG